MGVIRETENQVVIFSNTSVLYCRNNTESGLTFLETSSRNTIQHSTLTSNKGSGLNIENTDGTVEVKVSNAH